MEQPHFNLDGMEKELGAAGKVLKELISKSSLEIAEVMKANMDSLIIDTGSLQSYLDNIFHPISGISEEVQRKVFEEQTRIIRY